MTSPLVVYALSLVAGAAAESAGLAWLLHAQPASLVTTNYRGARVLGRAGVTLIAPLALVSALGAACYGSLGARALPLVATAAAAGLLLLLGWIDDVYGSAETHGLAGHLTLLVTRGRVTTGAVKALGGALTGVGTALLMDVRGWHLLLAGAVIALSANTLNALDARPGRALKTFVAAAALLIAASVLRPPAGPAVVLLGLLGAALVLAPADLRERVMLGDSGANPLGCALGVTAVAVTPWPVWAALAVVLLACCLAGDRWSLSFMIDASPLLRRIDGWGRLSGRADQESDGK